MGIQLDPMKIWEINNSIQGNGVVRKNGCIINTGNNPNKEERTRKILENRKKFQLPQDEIDKIVLPEREPPKDPVTVRTENKAKLRRLKEILQYMEGRLNDIQEGNNKGVLHSYSMSIPEKSDSIHAKSKEKKSKKSVLDILDDEEEESSEEEEEEEDFESSADDYETTDIQKQKNFSSEEEFEEKLEYDDFEVWESYKGKDRDISSKRQKN